MSDNFNYAVPFIIQHEGGLCNATGDAGGVTKFGICQRSYPDVDIPNLTMQAAIDIYRRDFWKPAWDQLDKRIAAKVFDISVNCGPAWGPKILQRALGCPDDGVIGPQTIGLCQMANVFSLLIVMRDKLDRHYEDIVAEHPEDQKFLDGWESRAAWIPPA